jgi:gamma-glutamylcyclotransferase (GGCT)/AIG2-like uncharacterized protein YtfP
MPSRLFAYGTLRRGFAPEEIAAVAARLCPVGRAVTRGLLFDLGEYPGAVFPHMDARPRQEQAHRREDAPAQTMPWSDIEGEVYEVRDPSTWRALDDYEGFDADHPAASLFLRRRIEVSMIDHDGRTHGRTLCWAYEYNRPPQNAVKQATGHLSALQPTGVRRAERAAKPLIEPAEKLLTSVIG